MLYTNKEAANMPRYRIDDCLGICRQQAVDSCLFSIFVKKSIDKASKRGYTKQAVAAGRRGRPDAPDRLQRTSKKCLTSESESGKIYKSSRDGMAFEN